MDLKSAKKDAITHYWKTVKLALAIVVIRSKPEHLTGKEYAAVLIEKNIQRNLQTTILKENRDQIKEISSKLHLRKKHLHSSNNGDIFRIMLKLKSLLEYVEEKLSNQVKNGIKAKLEEKVLDEIINSISSILEVIQTTIGNKIIQYISPEIVIASMDLISKLFSTLQDLCCKSSNINTQRKMEVTKTDCENFIYFIVEWIMDSEPQNILTPFYADILFHLSRKSLLIFTTASQVVNQILRLGLHLSTVKEDDNIDFELFRNCGYLLHTMELLILDHKAHKKDKLHDSQQTDNNSQVREIPSSGQTQSNPTPTGPDSTQSQLNPSDSVEMSLPEFEFVVERLADRASSVSDKFPLFANYVWKINYIITCP